MKTVRTYILFAALLSAFGTIWIGCKGGGGDGPAPVYTYSISGTVLLSTGGGASGVTVNLTGTATVSTATDISGNYSFAGLSNGAYTVTPTKTAHMIRPTNMSVTINNADVAGINFTATPTYRISGKVVMISSGPPLAGVNVNLTGKTTASTTTDNSGNYTFASLVDGAYTITPTLSGHTFKPLNRQETVSGADVQNVDFTAAAGVTYNISGNVTGPWIEGITVTLGGDNSGTTQTDANGHYSITSVATGTYSLTPSLAGYMYTPASPTVVITSTNMTQDFTAVSEITSYGISGSVSYFSGSKTGRIYINALPSSCGNCTASSGTSIASSGTYTIRGLVPGDYVLTAWMDNMGTGVRNASNPAGSSTPVNVISNDVSGVPIIIADPVSAPTPTTPANLQVYPGSGSAMILWDGTRDNSGVETATSYGIYWGTDVNATDGGVITFGAREDTMYLQSAAGGTLYYKISSRVGAAESAASSVVGPITIGALPGANTVSGTVTFPGTATGPMYVLIIGESPGRVYVTRMASPSSPQYYSITGVPNGNYFAIFTIDMNDNGVVDLGDISNMTGLGPTFTLNVNGNVTADQALTGVNALAWVKTTHYLSGTVHSYSLDLEVYKGMKLPVAVTLVSGPKVVVPKDAGINPWAFTIFTPSDLPRPTVGDAYEFKVTYSDGSSETLTGSVNGVLDTFAENLTAKTDGTGGSTPSVPLFTWADPASAPAYHEYEFNLYGSDANWWYGVMPGSQHSVLYNVDGSASKANLTTGITYNWSVGLRDASHNYATKWSTYTPAP